MEHYNVRQKRKRKEAIKTRIFLKSVGSCSANMDHKRLLSCCVEMLDSFNPRIHGVLEHLNTCLATKLVRIHFFIRALVVSLKISILVFQCKLHSILFLSSKDRFFSFYMYIFV